MEKFFSDKIEEGIRLVWMQYDIQKIREGKQLLAEAAEEGDADAYCFLGRTYLGGNGLEESRDKAFELFEKSVEMGSSCGILTMMQFKKLSKKIIRDIDLAGRKKAEEEVLRKAEEGHAFCQNIMGMYYFWGGYWLANELDMEKEYENEDKIVEARMKGAIPWFEKALFNGYTNALINLLDIYQYFEAEEEVIQKALKFAAECGDPFWEIYYANWLFEKGQYEASMEKFVELAKEGYSRAWYDIGFQYERGIGMEADAKKAIQSYEEGAKEGNPTSQIRLGKLLLWGELAEKDEAQAYFWFCKAAEQKDQIALMWKGHCMLYGLGTKKDMNEATNLLIDALNFNFPGAGESQQMAEESQFDWEEDMLQLFWDLGDAYENGLGMPKKQHHAGYYFSMVAAGGWPEAIEKMEHYRERGLFKRWKRID